MAPVAWRPQGPGRFIAPPAWRPQAHRTMAPVAWRRQGPGRFIAPPTWRPQGPTGPWHLWHGDRKGPPDHGTCGMATARAGEVHCATHMANVRAGEVHYATGPGHLRHGDRKGRGGSLRHPHGDRKGPPHPALPPSPLLYTRVVDCHFSLYRPFVKTLATRTTFVV